MVDRSALEKLLEIIQNTSFPSTIMKQFNMTNTTEFTTAFTEMITTTAQADCTCNTELLDIYSKQYHGYLSIIVCFFGTLANMLNITVLTRKEMAVAPINRILTGLAVADMLLMIEYAPFAYYYHFLLQDDREFPYGWTLYMLFHNHYSQVLHTTSICLTLALAIWRYLAIGYPERSHILCTDRRCTLAIWLSFLLPFVLCSPIFVMFTIKSTIIVENVRNVTQNFTPYYLYLSEIGKSEAYLSTIFWIYAVFIKLLPCAILACISYWLIRTLFRAKKRKDILNSYDVCPTILNEKDGKKKPNKAERRADRTTRMLVAVLLLFLITEFPQGIFALKIGIRGKCFFLGCYQTFGAVIDMLALVNGSINFILYCCMSRMFRSTFKQLFKHKVLARLAAASNSDTHMTTFTKGTNSTEL